MPGISISRKIASYLFFAAIETAVVPSSEASGASNAFFSDAATAARQILSSSTTRNLGAGTLRIGTFAFAAQYDSRINNASAAVRRAEGDELGGFEAI